MQLFDLEIRVKENLCGELEVSYLSFRGFTGKKCRRSMYGQGYFLECIGKREQKVSILLGKAVWEFLKETEMWGMRLTRLLNLAKKFMKKLQILG